MVKDEKPLEKEFNGDERFIDEEKEIFRYEGKKPKTKEAGILMLSDAVEAAVKSVEKPNLNKVENIIKTIIQDKIEEGQLDDCPLSLKDIEIIRNSFVKTFSGMFHKRIEYNGEKNKNR